MLTLLTGQAQSTEYNPRLSSIIALGNLCEDVDPAIYDDNMIGIILFALLENVIPN